MSASGKRPRAFTLEQSAKSSAPEFLVETQPDAFAAPAIDPGVGEAEAQVEAAQRRGVLRRALWSWSGLFWSAAGALVSIAVGLWIDSLIEALFSRFAALGWVAVALVAIAGLALFVLATRELAGVLRQRRIASLHARLAAALANDDREAARRGLRELAALYLARPETASARAHLGELTREIVDARDLLEIAERTLVRPLDAQAQRQIALAARRVSAVTTLSPRALFDVLFVAAQAVRLVRRIAEIYGGRPGLFGLVRIGRSVVSHLAITGGMAVGDSIVQQIVGHGLAARLSARLGEGVLNGLLTARVGLSAMAVCRPLPFIEDKQPGVADVAPFLFGEKDRG
ncbi:MAG TPA: TIGR01620 family protein [Beijerinckiaceae bacterium]|nr:TIGR01620 family protein [Beijerinckiaceae bacterium]